MRISAIVAMSENRVIGKDNRLPWHMPADLQHFKQVTMSKPILMGRKTYESIGRSLPGRINVVVTRDIGFMAPGCLVVHSIEDALLAVASYPEVFVIGGALLYEQMLPYIERLYLTVIHHKFEGDTFFPEIEEKNWQQVECVQHVADEKNAYDYSFLVWDKKITF